MFSAFYVRESTRYNLAVATDRCLERIIPDFGFGYSEYYPRTALGIVLSNPLILLFRPRSVGAMLFGDFFEDYLQKLNNIRTDWRITEADLNRAHSESDYRDLFWNMCGLVKGDDRATAYLISYVLKFNRTAPGASAGALSRISLSFRQGLFQDRNQPGQSGDRSTDIAGKIFLAMADDFVGAGHIVLGQEWQAAAMEKAGITSTDPHIVKTPLWLRSIGRSMTNTLCIRGRVTDRKIYKLLGYMLALETRGTVEYNVFNKQLPQSQYVLDHLVAEPEHAKAMLEGVNLGITCARNPRMAHQWVMEGYNKFHRHAWLLCALAPRTALKAAGNPSQMGFLDHPCRPTIEQQCMNVSTGAATNQGFGF